MKFFTSTVMALAALASAVFVNGQENPIIHPDPSDTIVAGVKFTITWTPTTSGTITLTLRSGDSDNLDVVGTIVAGAENTGSYGWTPDASLPAGVDYAIMITSEDGSTNYTPLFAIESEVTVESASASEYASASSTTSAATSETSTTSASKTSTEVESKSKAPNTITSAPHASATHVPITNSTLITSTRLFSNSTTSTYSNSTTLSTSRTSTRSRTSTSSTGTTTVAEASATASATSANSATGLVGSPLALILCVFGAVVYLN